MTTNIIIIDCEKVLSCWMNCIKNKFSDVPDVNETVIVSSGRRQNNNFGIRLCFSCLHDNKHDFIVEIAENEFFEYCSISEKKKQNQIDDKLCSSIIKKFIQFYQRHKNNKSCVSEEIEYKVTTSFDLTD